MEFVVVPIAELISCLVPPVRHHMRYVVHPSRYVENLITTMEKLTEKRMEVQGSVDAARGRGEVIKIEVEAWLERVDVDRLQNEVTSLRDAIQENEGCLLGSCSVRYRVAKEAHTKIIFINELRTEGQFSAVSDTAPPPAPTPDFELFQSTEFAMKEIMRALEDENIYLVGVYGMDRVRKTTIAKELAKVMERDGLFDRVVMVRVSQHPVVKIIQGHKCFLERLKPEYEQILIILDDLWEPLELAKIGIPFGDDSNKRCKVVLTTRSQEVCSLMGTQVEIEVSVLTEVDGWNLFQKYAGDCVASPELHTVAREVAKECGGFPIALVTLARALRNKDPTMWATAACQLKRSTTTEISGMDAKVFSSIRLSYDFLEDEETKFCFLLCCLFPEDYEISEDALFAFVIGERAFKDVECLMEARCRLHAVLDKLQSLCLLLKGGDKYVKRLHGEYVKMHDVVRDVAIEISRQEDLGFQVKAGRGLEQWQEDKENPEICKRLSLMKNKIIKLSNRPECFQLVTLSLRDNRPLKEITDRFFEGMTSLTTLDLSFTSFSSLPSSISCLTNLRVLDMGRLAHAPKEWLPMDPPVDVSLPGNLKKLEILDLQNCGIWSLPEEMGCLTKLKSLNLTGNERLTIPPNVVSQWSYLEELYMRWSFDKWEIEGSEDTSKVHFSEVASLIGLTDLRLDISNVECLSAFVPIYGEKLARFQITVGAAGSRGISAQEWVLVESIPPVSSEYDTHMWFRGVVVPEELSNLSKMLLERTEEMLFKRCNGLKNVLRVVKISGGLNSVKALTFDSCGDLEYLVNEEVEKAPEIAFKSLEDLKLHHLKYLKEIYRGPLPNGYFNKLSILHVEFCNSLLTNVAGLITRLPNLEDLKVTDSRWLTEIFNPEGIEGGLAPLLKL